MLTDKKLATNVKALLIVFPRPLTLTYAKIEKWMLKFVDASTLVKHWTIKFFQPMFIVLSYLRAKREGNFTLDVFSFKNYYVWYYLKIIINLPPNTIQKLLVGEDVMRD